MPDDVVTLSTFGMQDKWRHDKDGVKKFIDGQIDNIKAMKVSFDTAAREVQRSPPKIILSALMIPQWKNGESYESAEYQEVKNEYLAYLREKCEEAGIIVEDFYKDVATHDEKKYLMHLEALGSTADLIKNRAIIKNQGNRHLQIDTNTIMVDKKAFYTATIGAERQQDGMNASYYDTSGLYVSPHNKVVYTCENSEFASNLAKQHDRYVAESKDRLDRKTPGSNQIYSVCFTKACMDTGLASYDRKYYAYWNQLWGCYPVNIEHPTFQMTQHIITAINMSWSQGDGKVDYCAALKSIKVPVTSTGDETSTLDFPSFSYLIKKYTNPKLSEESRSKLLAISDQAYDEQAINSVVSHVIQTKDIALLGALLRTIPDADGGKIIRKKLFDTFKSDPNFIDIIKNPVINDKVTPEALQTLAKFIPERAEFQQEKNRLSQKSEVLLLVRDRILTSNIEFIREKVYQFVKMKLDALGAPYIVTEEDKDAVFKSIDSLMAQHCMQDLTMEEFENLSCSATTNRLLNDKLKQQPAVVVALHDQDESIHNHIMGKIYLPPVNEQFNRTEIDKMVNGIANDVGFIRSQAIKTVFFKDPNVIKFIESLNELAAIRPLDDKREVLIERMANALVESVRAFDKISEIPADMGSYFKGHYDILKEEFPESSPEYNQLLASVIVSLDESEPRVLASGIPLPDGRSSVIPGETMTEAQLLIRHQIDIEANMTSTKQMKEKVRLVLEQIKEKNPEKTSTLGVINKTFDL